MRNRPALALLAAVGLAATAAPPARAADAEVRTFAVAVDGKPAGTFKMAYKSDADGTETIAVVAEVKVKTTLLTYTYNLRSIEAWKGDRLASVESYADDDGKKMAVKAAAADGGLSVTVNGKAKKGRADVLTSTGWRYPGDSDKPRAAVLFDIEDGSETAVKVEPLPAGRVEVAGKPVEVRRFKITGKDVDAEWCFDPAGRPVRQLMTWDGHKVVLELTALDR